MLISSSVYSKDTCKYTAKNLVINGNHEQETKVESR